MVVCTDCDLSSGACDNQEIVVALRVAFVLLAAVAGLLALVGAWFTFQVPQVPGWTNPAIWLAISAGALATDWLSLSEPVSWLTGRDALPSLMRMNLPEFPANRHGRPLAVAVSELPPEKRRAVAILAVQEGIGWLLLPVPLQTAVITALLLRPGFLQPLSALIAATEIVLAATLGFYVGARAYRLRRTNANG